MRDPMIEAAEQELQKAARDRLTPEHTLTAVVDSTDRAARLLELSNNAWDIGMVEGVLQGIELTPALLPNQKEAIASARQAISRIGERNRLEMLRT